MRIAFYAPLKSPTHGTPSGDRRVAGLLMDALAGAGHRVQVASTFRSYDGDGDEARQRALRSQGEALAPSRDDIPGLEQLIEAKRILHLPPFLDTAPYTTAIADRAALRAELAKERALDPAVPWIAVVAMMRAGDKLASYRGLAAALEL